MNEAQSGLLLLDKPEGITSFRVLAEIKDKLRTSQVGHTGTLDRFATGLLLVLVGRLTRLAHLFSGCDKTYRATLILGQETNTLDPEGNVVAQARLPSRGELLQAMQSLCGDIEQVPPQYSAVHLAGERAYQLARSGRQPALKPRRVTIHKAQLLDCRDEEAEVLIRCSTGTYVRAWARDLGRRAGSCAYVKKLRRTAIGDFGVEEAVRPEEFDPARDILSARTFIPRLRHVKAGVLSDTASQRVLEGRPLRDGDLLEPPGKDGLYALFDPAGTLLATAERVSGSYTYKAVLARRDACRS